MSCYWYHKGKTFQANHNKVVNLFLIGAVVIDTTKVRLFKQITTTMAYQSLMMRLLLIPQRSDFSSKSQLSLDNALKNVSCYWYHKGKTFQANHNPPLEWRRNELVVIDTTKVRLFKQITTIIKIDITVASCYWYHKGKTFQANHNLLLSMIVILLVVIDTTKVRLFKQITTKFVILDLWKELLLIPQR